MEVDIANLATGDIAKDETRRGKIRIKFVKGGNLDQSPSRKA
jgi:hypothetical protein